MLKKFFSVFLLCLLVFVTVAEKSTPPAESSATAVSAVASTSKQTDYIKWVDFNITYEALKDAMELDIETFEQDLHLPWVESLAYLAAQNGGNFKSYKKTNLQQFAEARQAGSSMDDLTKNLKVYDYYYNAYSAVIGNLLGLRKDGTYGLTAYSPVAAGYWYTESDDFGNGRSYGFARKHLGHDMFCSVGTPIIAVEDGKVEALGWNQYGGWRIGIRSGDGQRYYYYAHLRKDTPYIKNLKIGDSVKAGQVIGYSGQTGYSIKENVNNINVPHLHFGMQLIFDESQKECLSEIWIDTYPLIRLLTANRSQALAPAAAETEIPADPADTKEVPILMYHGLSDGSIAMGDYYVSQAAFESDLKYLKENGYTTITMSELIDYVYDKTGKMALPEKPVILTFDDGFLNNHTYGTDLLKKYQMKAVISVIGSATKEMSNTLYKNKKTCAVTWEELSEMQKSGVWEVQNHTYDLHDLNKGRKGASRKAGEAEEAYEKMLKEDLSSLQTELKKTLNTVPNTFTWPYGAYTKDCRSLLKTLGFEASLSCNGGVNKIQQGDTEGLFLLKRNIRTPRSNIAECLND